MRSFFSRSTSPKTPLKASPASALEETSSSPNALGSSQASLYPESLLDELLPSKASKALLAATEKRQTAVQQAQNNLALEPLTKPGGTEPSTALGPALSTTLGKLLKPAQEADFNEPKARLSEWKQLFRLLQQAQAGSPRTALVMSQAGLGKTWLLQQLKEAAAQELGAPCLWLNLQNTPTPEGLAKHWQAALLHWASTILQNVLQELKTVHLPFPIEPGQWQWEAEHVNALLNTLEQGASTGQPASELLAPELDALWKPFYTRWQRFTFSLQDATEQVTRLLEHPLTKLAYSFQKEATLLSNTAPITPERLLSTLQRWGKALTTVGLAGLVVFDHWDTIALLEPTQRAGLLKTLHPLLDALETQKANLPVLGLVACQTEAASSALGSRLFTQFRTRLLLDPLPPATIELILQHWQASQNGLPLEASVSSLLSHHGKGNLGFLKWLWQTLQSLAKSQGQATITSSLLASYLPLSPTTVWTVEWAKLHWLFAEDSSRLHKALSLLIRSFGGQGFGHQAVNLLWHPLGWKPEQSQMTLQHLASLGWLVYEPAMEAIPNSEPVWQWAHRCVLSQLQERYQQPYEQDTPLQERPLQQLVMERIVPLAIASGELQERQINTLMQLAATAKEAATIRQQLEALLLKAAKHSETRVRLCVLNALSTLGSQALPQVVCSALADEHPVVKEAAARTCLAMVPLLEDYYKPLEEGSETPLKEASPEVASLLQALEPLKKDASPSVVVWAYRAWFALQTRVQKTLQPTAIEQALRHPLPGVQALALEHLAYFITPTFLSQPLQTPLLASTLKNPTKSPTAEPNENTFSLAGEAPLQSWNAVLLNVVQSSPSQAVRRGALACLIQAEALNPDDWLSLTLNNEEALQITLITAACQIGHAVVTSKLVEALVKNPNTSLTEASQLALLKGLATWPNQQSEGLLLRLLQAGTPLPWSDPVLWMLLRSLSKVATSQTALNALQALPAKEPRLQRLPLLYQVHATAVKQLEIRCL